MSPDAGKESITRAHYLTVLRWIHKILGPVTYVEIGVCWGGSLGQALPQTQCIGIDPNPRLGRFKPRNARVFQMTSGAFFERYELGHILGAPQFSLAFIDGMHLFEQAFLDFIALEKYASPASVIMIHDCLPLDRRTSDRTRTTDFYSGDVWKLVWCLKEQRPDLRMVTVRCRPTGLCLVCGLDPHSDALERRRDEHIARYTALSYEDYTNSPSRMPDTIDNNFAVIESWLKDAAMIRDPLRGLLK